VSHAHAGRLRSATSVVRDVVSEVRERNVPFMAGSIAYSAFVSLFPLLVLSVIAASFLGGEAFAEYVVRLTQSYLSPSGQQLIVDSLTQASQRTRVSVLTLVVFLWATLRLFRGLDVAFSILYGTDDRKGLPDQVKNGLIVLGALSVALFGSILIWVALFTVVDVPLGGIVPKLLLVPFLTVAFLPMYYVFPDTDLSVREILPGAVVAALGWTGLQAGFQFYVAVSDKTELYGVIGGVLLIITWLYFGSLIVLVGATINVVLQKDLQSPRPTTLID
jgi:membrane protein